MHTADMESPPHFHSFSLTKIMIYLVGLSTRLAYWCYFVKGKRGGGVNNSNPIFIQSLCNISDTLLFISDTPYRSDPCDAVFDINGSHLSDKYMNLNFVTHACELFGRKLLHSPIPPHVT